MSKTCLNCDHYCACSKWYGYDDETGEAVRRNGGCWSGWHDAKEELPAKDKNVVLLIDGESVGFGWMRDDSYYALWGDLSSLTSIRKERVTHWRELPKYKEK